MRLIVSISILASTLLLSACLQKGPNPEDPYESINRPIHKFNMAVDATMLKPAAKIYKAVIPGPVRTGVNNAFSNVLLPQAVASDLLQGDWRYAIKDSWRFMINSTFGVAGLFDVAASSFALPPHYNDLGLTFAKWGDKKSPYIVLPLLGPTTIRDGMAIPFEYGMMPYAYITNNAILYPVLALRYVDLRTQLLESEPMLDEAFDKYTFIRDAYLQHRNYQISGKEVDTNGSIYLDEHILSDYVDEEQSPSEKAKPTTKSNQTNAAHSSVPTRNPTQHG